MTVGAGADPEATRAAESETSDQAGDPGVAGTRPDMRPEPGAPPDDDVSPDADTRPNEEVLPEADSSEDADVSETLPDSEALPVPGSPPDADASPGTETLQDPDALQVAGSSRDDDASPGAETVQDPDALPAPRSPQDDDASSEERPEAQPAAVQEAAGPRAPLAPSATWHRFHFAIGVFLVAYGVTGLLSAVLMWGDRQDEVEGYLGALPATAVLTLVKLIELALVASAAAGLALRRDLLFVPPIVGWMAGFATFAVLDVFTGRWGGLAEHLLYLAAFVVLLFLSFGLSAKVQLSAAKREAAAGDGGSGSPNDTLTRLQTLAVQTLDRIPRP